jgi:ADP-ribose pyrophosphatase YjhB (NUDIX family)
MINDKNLVLVSGACAFREVHGKISWFLIKIPDADNWEIPKVLVRKGESSVRASLRLMSEKGGMNVRVLEEAGRSGGVTSINGKTFPQRHIYYLMLTKFASEEPLGFTDYTWLEYSKAARKIASKREKQMLKAAKTTLIDWKKKRQKRRNLAKKQ